MKNPVVTIEMENGDIMKAELYPEIAPNTVNNFISLIKKGFYDGLIFHRVIKGFMIQGGCPNGNGMGGPGYTIKGEFSQNGFTNNFKHTKGVLSMARAMDPNSAGSQFFIMHETSPHLDGQYASFGKVVEGLDIVDKIAARRTSRDIKTSLSQEEYKSIIRLPSVRRRAFEEIKGIHTWNLIVVIPLKLMGLDPSNLPEKILGNFYKCADETMNPHFVSWSPIDLPEPNFHCPEFFGEIYL